MWNKTSDRIENVEIERLASNEIDQSDTQRRSQQNLVIFVFNNHLFSCLFCATFMIFGNARHSTYCLDVEMSLELLLDPRKLQQVRTVPLSANYFVSSPSSIIHITTNVKLLPFHLNCSLGPVEPIHYFKWRRMTLLTSVISAAGPCDRL